jgi:homoserine kinase
MARTAMEKCSARAPCSTANLGPGYDVFGLALDALEDRVTLSRSGDPGISLSVSGSDIPIGLEMNSAGRVVKRMTADFGIKSGIKVQIQKGIPAGYGMGSSGASAAAAALAFNALFELNIELNALVEYAAEGELASAGSRHYDNVSASLLGGFVISRFLRGKEPRFIKLTPPSDLFVVVAVPQVTVPKQKTQIARGVLPQQVPLASVVHNVSAACTIVAGFASGDVETIASGIDDVIVEPARKNLIAGYEEVKKLASEAGALAVTISGAGPSMISVLKTDKRSVAVAEAMKAGFAQVGVASQAVRCRPSQGAQID